MLYNSLNSNFKGIHWERGYYYGIEGGSDRDRGMAPNNTRILRMLFGFTQEFVAEQLHISRSTYSGIENGSRKLSLITAVELSTLYEIPVDAIWDPELTGKVIHFIQNTNI